MASVGPRVKVQPEYHFVGFDAYQKLVKSDIDIVMLTTPPGYRPIHFEAAVEAGKHVFTEKPIATDATGARRFMAAGRKAAEKKLTVMSGAQRHEDKPYMETVQKIHDGAIGDIVALNSFYLSGPVFHAQARDAKWGDMEWEHRNWYSFLWLCGDQIVEQHFHNIDFMNWVMGGHPERVVASGGAAWRPRAALYGNIFDHMNSDFVYPNGVHLASACRQYPRGTFNNVSDLVVGTKGRSTGIDLGTQGHQPLCPGAHQLRGQHPGARAVHQPVDSDRREHADLHHGARVRVLGDGDHVGPDHELEAGPDAERVRLRSEDGSDAAAGTGRI